MFHCSLLWCWCALPSVEEINPTVSSQWVISSTISNQIWAAWFLSQNPRLMVFSFNSSVYIYCTYMLFNVNVTLRLDVNTEKWPQVLEGMAAVAHHLHTNTSHLTRAETVSGALLLPPYQPDSTGNITAPLPVPTIILLNNVEAGLLLPSHTVAARAAAPSSTTLGRSTC